MPSHKPRTRRSGAYADRATLRPELSASASAWPCPTCDCRRNLRGLLREICSNCGHTHQPPTEKKEPAPCP